MCSSDLLEDPNVEISVRRGDIYALLVETFTSLGQYDKAVEAIDEMKSVLSHNPIKYFKGDTLQVSCCTSKRISENLSLVNKL